MKLVRDVIQELEVSEAIFSEVAQKLGKTPQELANAISHNIIHLEFFADMVEFIEVDYRSKTKNNMLDLIITALQMQDVSVLMPKGRYAILSDKSVVLVM